MAVVLRFQSTGAIPGNGDPIEMRGPSLTIGRGNENDLVLPDPDKVLSKRHCAIEDHNGNVIVVDFSTNGTFLNYGKLALGATPTPINDGDILSVGPYEILVNVVVAGQDNLIADPLADGPVSHGLADNAPSPMDLLDAPGDGGDFLDDLLGGREGPQGPGAVERAEPDEDGLLPPLGEDDPFLAPPADPYEGQGASAGMHNAAGQDNFVAPQVSAGGGGAGGGAIPDDWDDDFLSPAAAPSPSPAPAASPAAQPAVTIPDDILGPDTDPFIEPGIDDLDLGDVTDPGAQTQPLASAAAPMEDTNPPVRPVAATTAPPAAAPQPVVASSGDAAARAFLSAVGADDVEVKDSELVETMDRMGQVMRIMIEGMREILMTRTSIKSEFRIEQTMISMGGNNPLKFSLSTDNAVESMVRPNAKGYLPATDAVSEALQDVKAHEIATITGMEAALKGVLAKLNPAVLEEKIVDVGGLAGMLRSKKARYWEVYETMYAEISDQAENDFQELFSREFARAYQEQLDKLK